MKKYFVCLANSKKYSQRCIAGIEVEKHAENFRLVKENNEPKWIRPVTKAEHGEVSCEQVENINLLDIVEVEVTNPCPNAYQSENVLFESGSLKPVRPIQNIETAVPLMTTNKIGFLFGNKGKAVAAENARELDHSLLFIKPDSLSIEIVTTTTAFEQVRARFEYRNVIYDFPVTDLDFLKKCSREKDFLRSYKNVFLTISLGVAFENRHYKLVAGIVYY